MRLTRGCIYCLIAERLPGSAAGLPPCARRPLSSRSRLSRCSRRWLQARNKSRGRARAHGPRAQGGQEARHHSGTVWPRAAPVRRRRGAAPQLGQHGHRWTVSGSLLRGRELGGFARKAARWPSCWQGIGGAGWPELPKIRALLCKGDWVALEGTRHLVEWGP